MIRSQVILHCHLTSQQPKFCFLHTYSYTITYTITTNTSIALYTAAVTKAPDVAMLHIRAFL